MQHPIERLLREAADRHDEFPQGPPPDAVIDTLGLPSRLRAEFVEACKDVARLAFGGEGEQADAYARERAGEIITRRRASSRSRSTPAT